MLIRCEIIMAEMARGGEMRMEINKYYADVRSLLTWRCVILGCARGLYPGGV